MGIRELHVHSNDGLYGAGGNKDSGRAIEPRKIEDVVVY